MEQLEETTTSLDIASYIAYECDNRQLVWNNTKIQKLLYVVYGVFLARENQRICEEYPRAWQYGPVFPIVFKTIKEGLFSPCNTHLSFKTKNTVIEVIESFGQYSAGALTEWSHAKDSPWDMVMRDGDNLNSFIPDDFIKNYFMEKVLTNE